MRACLVTLFCAVGLSAFGQFDFTDQGMMSRMIPQAATAQGTPIDLLFQWTGTQGILTTNIVVASEIGSDKGVIQYTESHPDFQHTFITNESYSFPVVNIGGLLYSNNTQSIVFNIDAADLGRSPVYEGFQYLPTGSYSNFSVWFGIQYNSGGSWNNDSVNIAGGQYAVMENIITTGSGYLNAHGQLGGNTSKFGVTDNILNGHDYRVTLRFNAAAQSVDVMCIDAANGFLVGAGSTNSDLSTVTNMKIQDYLLNAGVSTGNIRWRQICVATGAKAIIPLEPMPTVLPITNMAAVQIATNEIDVSWGKQAYTSFLLERNDGTNWSTVLTNYATTYADTTALVTGATYTYRVTAKAFQYLSSSVSSSPVTIINTTWHDSIAPGSADTDDNSDSGVAEYGKVTLSGSGTAVKLRVWTSDDRIGFTSTTKLALFDGSKHLLATGTVNNQADNSAHYMVATIANTSVSSGDYYVGYINSVTGSQSWRYKSTGGFRFYKFQAYAAFPSDPIGEDGSQALDVPVGILTQ